MDRSVVFNKEFSNNSGTTLKRKMPLSYLRGIFLRCLADNALTKQCNPKYPIHAIGGIFCKSTDNIFH